ncbi:hypothetical protein ScPMuIL_003507 [Solemya velum]
MEKEPNASDREEKRCRLRNVWESLKDICAICVADKLVLKEKTDDEQSLISIKIESPKKKWRKENFEGKKFGQYGIYGISGFGGMSCVYNAGRADGMALACKIVDGSSVAMLRKESDILRRLQHKNIISFRHYIEYHNCGLLFMEQAEMRDILDFVNSHWPLDRNIRRRWSKELIFAVKYLHSTGIVHRDIKCENILLSRELHIKLADFGSAHQASDRFKVCACNIEYLPPEVIRKQIPVGYDLRMIDVWSVGVVLFILLTRRMPFGPMVGSELDAIKWKYANTCEPEFTEYEKKLAEPLYIEIVKKLLRFDFVSRASFQDILASRYYSRSMDLGDRKGYHCKHASV